MTYPDMYYAGRHAAQNGERREACPHSLLDLFARCWWLAGYSDWQTEHPA